MPKDQNTKPILDERFLKNIKGKDFVLYAGLLDLAHQIGIQSIKVKTIQYPTKDNGLEAICEAHVESKNGENFIEIADASPRNVAPLVKEHVLRMAATRAKARALRDMTNVGITCLEELGNIDEIEDNKSNKNNSASSIRSVKKTESNTGAADGKNQTAGNQKKTEAAQKEKKENPKEEKSSDTTVSPNGPKMSSAQKKAILSLAQRRGLSEDDLTKLSIESFNVNFDYLDSSSASVFIRDLQQAA